LKVEGQAGGRALIRSPAVFMGTEVTSIITTNSRDGGVNIPDAARAYIDRGWAAIPLQGKNPEINGGGWQKRNYSAEDFLPGSNIGIILGSRSNGLVDIDLDCVEARRAAAYFLPDTNSGFGRGRVLTHLLYSTPTILPTTRFQDRSFGTRAGDRDKAVLVEFRSGEATHQTMFPPSIHPDTGERIEWHKDGEPAAVDAGALLEQVKQLAAASLLGRYWPKEGLRHEAALALAGGLTRSGWKENRIVNFIEAVAAVAGDEEAADRKRAARDTYQRLVKMNGNATGWPSLVRLLGPNAEVILKDVEQWLGLAPSAVRLSVAPDKSATITGPPTAPNNQGRELEATLAMNIVPENLEYLWPDYLPLGKLVGMYGNSTEGKSPVTVDLAARVTRGKDFPDGVKNAHGPGSVLLMSAEDDPADTIVPRFLLAGGDPAKLIIVKGSRPIPKEGEPFIGTDMVALDRDMGALRVKAEEYDGLALIVIDPITNHMGAKEWKDDPEVRQVLMPLADLAHARNISIIIVGHFNRREKGTTAQNRVMGAKAFYSVPRFIYLFGPDNDSQNRFAHIMVQDRGVGAPSWRYHTEAGTLRHKGKDIDKVVQVAWDSQCDAAGCDAVDPVSEKDKSAEDDAADILRDFVKDGEQAVHVCKEHLKSAGFDLDSLNQTRVRRKAHVEVQRRGKQYFWGPAGAGVSL
jgi:hypothetical protein